MKRKARSAVSLCERCRRNDWRRKGLLTCGRRASDSWVWCAASDHPEDVRWRDCGMWEPLR